MEYEVLSLWTLLGLYSGVLVGADGLVVGAVHVGGGVRGTVTGVGEYVGGVDWAVLGFPRLHVLWALVGLVVQGPHASVKQ